MTVKPAIPFGTVWVQQCMYPGAFHGEIPNRFKLNPVTPSAIDACPPTIVVDIQLVQQVYTLWLGRQRGDKLIESGGIEHLLISRHLQYQLSILAARECMPISLIYPQGRYCQDVWQDEEQTFRAMLALSDDAPATPGPPACLSVQSGS
jgi:hypothetical protein